MEELLNEISIGLPIKLVIRGSIALKILFNKNFKCKSDLDLLIENNSDFIIFLKHLENKFKNVKIGEYIYKNENLPRKKIKLIFNEKLYNIDVLITKNYFTKTSEKYNSIFIPSDSDILASKIIALCPNIIGIDFKNNLEKKKMFYQSILSLSSVVNLEELIHSIYVQLNKQNEFYSTNIDIYELIYCSYFDFVRSKINNPVFYKDIFLFDIFSSISEKLVGSKNDTTIDFYNSNEKYGCFSNYSNHSLEYDNKIWKTAEHCYQAQKFINIELKELIRKQKNPKQAAKIGRAYSNLLRLDWDFVRVIKMFTIVKAKVLQNPFIYVTLLATKDKIIKEVSMKDDFWGIGKNKKGKNYLGKIFMSIRKEIF